jgi:hypothetical protein
MLKGKKNYASGLVYVLKVYQYEKKKENRSLEKCHCQNNRLNKM